VLISPELRQAVETALVEIRAMLALGRLPPPRNDDHCRACSLHDLCQPEVLANSERQRRVLDHLFSEDD